MDHRSPHSPNSPRAAAPAVAAEPSRPSLRARVQRWLGRWTLRRKLLAGFTLSLLPLIVLLAYTLDQRFTARRAEELRSNREFAEAVVSTFDGYISDIDHQLLAQAFTL